MELDYWGLPVRAQNRKVTDGLLLAIVADLEIALRQAMTGCPFASRTITTTSTSLLSARNIGDRTSGSD
jgi:hypothetical protein